MDSTLFKCEPLRCKLTRHACGQRYAAANGERKKTADPLLASEASALRNSPCRDCHVGAAHVRSSPTPSWQCKRHPSEVRVNGQCPVCWEAERMKHRQQEEQPRSYGEAQCQRPGCGKSFTKTTGNHKWCSSECRIFANSPVTEAPAPSPHASDPSSPTPTPPAPTDRPGLIARILGLAGLRLVEEPIDTPRGKVLLVEEHRD